MTPFYRARPCYTDSRRYFSPVPAVCAILLFVVCGNLFGQHAVDPSQRYHRLICLVHLTGSGKHNDPILPEYVPSATVATSAQSTPVPAAGNSGNTSVAAASATNPRSGIISWSMQLTDDGKMAIIHVVAVDRNTFAPILADTRSEIRVFEIGKDTPEAIEKEMKKYKKDFTLDSIKVVAQ